MEKVPKVIEQKVENALAIVERHLVIQTDEQLTEVVEIATNIKKLSKFVTAEKEKITKPLNDALKAARTLFAPYEANLAEAEAKLKTAMVKYHNEQEAKRKLDEERIAARVEKGTMTEKTAVKKIEDLGTEKKTVTVENGAVQFKQVRKVRFSSISHLKEEEMVWLARNGYIVWDEVKTRKDALAGTVIPGVEVYEETSSSIG